MLRPSACCRVWGAVDLAPLQTLNNGTGWVTDFAYLEGPPYNKLVVAAQDRTVGGGGGGGGGPLESGVGWFGGGALAGGWALAVRPGAFVMLLLEP